MNSLESNHAPQTFDWPIIYDEKFISGSRSGSFGLRVSFYNDRVEFIGSQGL